MANCTTPFVRAFALSAALIAAVVVSAPVAAVTGWTSPLKILDGHYSNVSMAVDTHGTTHVAAQGKAGIWYVTNKRGSWSRTLVTAASHPGADADPSLALDGSNHVYIAFGRTGDPCPPPDICGSCSRVEDSIVTDRSGSFGPPVVIAGCRCHRPSLRVRAGRLNVAYAADGTAPHGPLSEYPVYFATNRSGSWTWSVAAHAGEDPSLRISGDGRARIAYVDWETGVSYVRETAGGFVKGHEEGIVNGEAPRGGAPDLVLDAANLPRIAWSDPGAAGADPVQPPATQMDRFTTGEWSTDVVTSRWTWQDDEANRGPAIVIDAAGATHVLVAPGAGGVYHSTDASGSWVETTLSPTLVSRGKVALAMTPANRVVAVFAAESGNTHGLYLARRAAGN